jgi:hypothetical protein
MQNLAAAVERRWNNKQHSHRRLPRSINSCLDEFTKQLGKAKNLQLRMNHFIKQPPTRFKEISK